jgi:chromosome partitioning protein
MGSIFAVVNQKGGVGKTTTALNLATDLALQGKHVLLVDADPQASATSGVGVEKGTFTKSIFEVLVDGALIADSVVTSELVSGLDIVPSSWQLAGAEVEMAGLRDREFLLKKALLQVAPLYDFIVIDGPPSLGLITINVLAAANSLIIPVQCEYYALEGITMLMEVIERIKAGINPALEIGLVVMTMHDERIILSRSVIAEVREVFGDHVARTVIPRNVRLSEAPSYGKPIALYDRRSRGAIAYFELAREVAAIGKR